MADAEAQKAELFEQIGRFKMELEWLKKTSPHSADGKHMLIQTEHGQLSVRRQCELRYCPRNALQEI